MNKLLTQAKKFNVSGPRYTSYPTALQFEVAENDPALGLYLEERKKRATSLSLYIHIPFCFSLCWYCGCTKVITKNQDRGDTYIDYLEKEMKLLTGTLHPDSITEQIHFGGGTPTFLSPPQLLRLGSLLHRYFNLAGTLEFSVEIDPRRVSTEHIDAIVEIGCNRVSLGIQDTNTDVQTAIRRVQSFEESARITEMARNAGIESVNFDLIYGLPKQTLSTFKKTLDQVISLDPDRFAIYSYAHMPSIMPSQKLLNEADLPSVEEKLSMLVHAVNTLPARGYNFIGMDHFAKEADELSIALNNGTLQRNFQGYSTRPELEMIGLGMSSISQGWDFYSQNEKDLLRYYQLLDEGTLPVKKILKLSEEDLLRRQIIMQIMCKGEILFDEYPLHNGMPFSERFSEELASLAPFEKEGLIQLSEKGVKITPDGRLFLRNIAMVFDEYLQKKIHQNAYSKTI